MLFIHLYLEWLLGFGLDVQRLKLLVFTCFSFARPRTFMQLHYGRRTIRHCISLQCDSVHAFIRSYISQERPPSYNKDTHEIKLKDHINLAMKLVFDLIAYA